MSKSFAREFENAVNGIHGNHMEPEKDRVHREAVRDKNHAFRNVDIPKPNPWKTGTPLSL